jgi:molybdopterin-binding protein
MKLSARNALKGTVKHIQPGAVNAEVTVEIAGGHQLVSIITMKSVSDLGLAPGKAVYAVIKASNVMLGVDH